jgi:hypothetical protein
MKTLFVSLAALVAVSGAAFAAGGDDLRNSDTYFGKYSAQNKAGNYATESNALIILKGDRKKETAFERMNRISEEGGKDNGHDHDNGAP